MAVIYALAEWPDSMERAEEMRRCMDRSINNRGETRTYEYTGSNQVPQEYPEI